MSLDIVWLGHAGFRVSNDVTIYVDPWKLKEPSPPQADLVLITHSHFDHLSSEDVARIQGPETVILAPGDCVGSLSGATRAVRAGEAFEVKGVSIEVVPAYNIDKDFHPRERNWVGYVFTVEGKHIYHPGDTDLIPEMDSIRADIALLPVSGTYVMTATEAAEAAKRIQPDEVIPMHYGDIVGTEEDARTFSRLWSGKTRIMQPKH